MSYDDQLEKKLLSYDGNTAHVIQLGGENICKKILTNGIYVKNPEAITMNNQNYGLCHNNAINIWANNIDKYRLCTGYALDGKVWYRHSWCIDENGTIIECTPQVREAYYGVPLSLVESRKFLSEILYPNEIKEIESKFSK